MTTEIAVEEAPKKGRGRPTKEEVEARQKKLAEQEQAAEERAALDSADAPQTKDEPKKEAPKVEVKPQAQAVESSLKDVVLSQQLELNKQKERIYYLEVTFSNFIELNRGMSGSHRRFQFEPNNKK